MAPPTRTPRAAWIEAGLRALAAGGGPDAVRVETLAKSLGVTRGGFYGQFKDRGALLEAMLDTWERAATDEVLEQVERRGGDARAKVRRAGALTFSEELAADRPGDPRLGPARRRGRCAPAAGGQPAHGLSEAAVRIVLRRRGRRSKAARCLRSRLPSAPTSSPPTTDHATAAKRSSSPSAGCSPERAPLRRVALTADGTMVIA